jgi:hypothetical protein
MSDELVTVRRFLWQHEAQIARGLLESAGIPAFLQDVHLAQADWLSVQAIGWMRLQVPKEHAEQATELLDHRMTTETADANPCPACGAYETERVITGRQLAGLGLLFGFPFWRQRSAWRCSNCKRAVDADD